VPDTSYTNATELDRHRGKRSSQMSIAAGAVRLVGEGRNEPAPRTKERPMTATTLTATSSTTTSTTRPTVWKAGLVAAVAAGAATTAVAALARAVDIPLTMDGEAIPVAGFAQLTVFFSLIGVALARFIGRRSAFRTTTVVLTALSLVPDVAVSASTATKLTLMATHLVAAAIVIPALSNRLPESR
jgi:hypothetical protein